MAETLPRLTAEADIPTLHEALRSSGAVIVEHFLGAETVAATNAELDPFVEAAPEKRPFLNPALAWFFGDKTRHVTGVTGKSPTFAAEILCHPVLDGLAHEVLGPACSSHQLNVAHVLDPGPGAKAQVLHRDELVWVHLPRPHPEVQLATIIALQDFSAENGATRIIPGSHRWPIERIPDESEVADAEMPAGSAVIYLGSTIHGGGANTTSNQRRRGLHLSYVAGWLRSEENNLLSTPPDVARTLPRRARELVGYQVHDAIAAGGGYLGAVDLQDPAVLLEQGKL
ncbi:MAG: phytanoyl-CoA dioxygenase family protein [Myxococcota bacterium]|jgi:ectoine hydroxylase-related dioxygenase (phytanoyl-CoA dioxygenase family)